MKPVYFRCQPVGCTATIVYSLYKENKVEITPDMAGLMCSAILSDTLMYRSPTCTPLDKMAAEALAKIAGIQVEEYAMQMFEAGSDLKSKSDADIFYQDFKKFSAGDIFVWRRPDHIAGCPGTEKNSCPSLQYASEGEGRARPEYDFLLC